MWVIFLETDSLFSDKAVAEVSAPTEIDMADHQEKEDDYPAWWTNSLLLKMIQSK